MKRLALLGCVCVSALLGIACGPPIRPPGGGCCGKRTNVDRTVVYTGVIPATDGGMPTEVRLSLSAGGSTAITFVNGGREIVQGYNAVTRFP